MVVKPMKETTGRIIRGVGGIYSVALDGGMTVSCRARGSLRASASAASGNSEARLERPLTGDMVRVSLSDGAAERLAGRNAGAPDERQARQSSPQDGSEAVICEIMPRRNALIRPPVANLDCIFAVCAAARPAPVLPTLDKLLSIAEHNGIEPVIVVGKCELNAECAAHMRDIYRRAGYPVFTLSCATGEGIPEFAEFAEKKFCGRVSAFAGASGVGKSTLLNTLFPSFELRTGGVSEKIGRGRHTTREAVLCPLPGGGYIADTPGFSLLDLVNFDFFDLDDLPGTMREFVPCCKNCRYTDCTHTKEEGCAVLDAVSKGEIAPERHESYLAMYAELKSKPYRRKAK